MKLTKIIAHANRKFNHPYESYSNIGIGMSIEAELTEEEAADLEVARLCRKDLRELCNKEIEEQKQEILKELRSQKYSSENHHIRNSDRPWSENIREEHDEHCLECGHLIENCFCNEDENEQCKRCGSYGVDTENCDCEENWNEFDSKNGLNEDLADIAEKQEKEKMWPLPINPDRNLSMVIDEINAKLMETSGKSELIVRLSLIQDACKKTNLPMQGFWEQVANLLGTYITQENAKEPWAREIRKIWRVVKPSHDIPF